MKPPGPLLASGRDSDIFDCGPGLVLRRSRHGRSMAREARTMEYARSQGYPVPAVDEVSDDGTELVMERLDGPSMADFLGRRPWTLATNATVMAQLHRKLHEITAPEWLPAAPTGEGSQLIHLDLHPLNIMLTTKGPMVIDWPNAARGDGNVDLALTWVLLACGAIPAGRVKAAVMARGRGILINRLLRSFDLSAVQHQLPGVVAWKTTDPNMSPAECNAMKRLADRQGR